MDRTFLPIWLVVPIYAFLFIVGCGCGLMVVVKLAMFFFKP